MQKGKSFLSVSVPQSNVVAQALVVCVAALLLSVAGPFGTYEEGNFWDRFFYWMVTCLLGLGVALLARRIADTHLAKATLLQREGVIVGVLTIVFTPILRVWTIIAFPGVASQPPSIAVFGFSVLLVCLSLSVLVNSAPLIFAARTEEKTERADVRISKRLPEGFDGQILRLSAENHTVVVETSEGVHRLRMRMSDAIEEVEGVEGFIVHRSHWVARDAMSHVTRSGGKNVVVLNSGEEVPVSRTYFPLLEAAGVSDGGSGT